MALNIWLDPSQARPLYLQIIDEVRRAVVRGDIEQDECLPSVRELSSELGVNPSTVRQAFQVMEREGLVYFQRGRGTFVSSTATSENEATKVAEQVAERAIREAHGSGITVDDLLSAILKLREVREGWDAGSAITTDDRGGAQ